MRTILATTHALLTLALTAACAPAQSESTLF